MKAQEISRIPERTAITILKDYFKDCSLDTTNKTNAFGRIILSQYLGDTKFIISEGNFIGITGYFNHKRGSEDPPKRNKKITREIDNKNIKYL